MIDSSRLSRRYLRLLPVLIWMMMIFALSEQRRIFLAEEPAPGQPAATPGASRTSGGGDGIVEVSEPGLLLESLGHALLYAGLAVLLYWGLAGIVARRRMRAGLALLIALLYGAFDEWHQSFVPNRGMSLRDLLADLAGAALGLALVWLLGWYRRRALSRDAGGSGAD